MVAKKPTKKVEKKPGAKKPAKKRPASKAPAPPMIFELVITDPSKGLRELMEPGIGFTASAAITTRAGAKALHTILLNETSETWLEPKPVADPSLDDLLTPYDLRAGLEGVELTSALKAYKSLVEAIKDSKRPREGHTLDVLRTVKIHRLQSPETGDWLELITKADFKELFGTPQVLAVKKTMYSYFIGGKSLPYGDKYHEALLSMVVMLG